MALSYDSISYITLDYITLRLPWLNNVLCKADVWNIQGLFFYDLGFSYYTEASKTIA